MMMRWMATPDRRETYYPPQVITGPDGREMIIYGTGGNLNNGIRATHGGIGKRCWNIPYDKTNPNAVASIHEVVHMLGAVSDAAPCECTFAQLVVSVDGYHDEATKSLLTDCCSTCCHTIAAAETQFAALAEQIRSFQTEHGLPACR